MTRPLSPGRGRSRTRKAVPVFFPLLVLLSVLLSGRLPAQNFELKTATEEGFTYEYVPGDPTATRIYTLANGLRVYLSVFRDKPQIFTLIPVRAGSKNDPATNTGLAHYLEHMVFKGTSRIGARDYSREKILLDSIEKLFNQYGRLTDPVRRKALYRRIDQLSYQASRLCYANEYDKILGALGAQNVNAFTSTEQTVYMASIPSNQLRNWLEVERERFRMLVPRLFHTELEAVYEEKNISLDSDNDQAQEALMRGLYPNHPYGTQTTIGTVAHLKNPSITEIKKYFNRYYVPGNMAICLAGDLDYGLTIRQIDSLFRDMPARPVPVFVSPVVPERTSPAVKTVVGPSEEVVLVGFRLPGMGTREALLAKLVDQMLQNAQAGLIDLNLNQKQKVLGAGCYLEEGKDFCTHQFFATPRKGQTAAQVRKLLLDQIDSLREGRFEDWLIPAIVNNIRISDLRDFDSNQGRAFVQAQAFVLGRSWEKVWNETAEMSGVTREEIRAFVRRWYGNTYVSVEKKTGTNPNIPALKKPAITPVYIDKDGKSDFYRAIAARKPPETEPVFLDFDRDIGKQKTSRGVEILSIQNKSNELFQFTLRLEAGNQHDSRYEIAARFLDFCGTGQLSSAGFRKELFKLGSEISVSTGTEYTYITLTGLQEKFNATFALMLDLISKPRGTEEDFRALIEGILKERENNLLDKRQILNWGLGNYARYGPVSPATGGLSNLQLKALKSADMLEAIREWQQAPRTLLYYGPLGAKELQARLDSLFPWPAINAPLKPLRKFPELAMDSNRVFWVDFDMVQTELLFTGRSAPQDSALFIPASIFNEYMGGNMSSLVYQELRESKALAYSAFGSYSLASAPDRSNYVTAYIGCQADKMGEAIRSMANLIEDMPVKDSSLALCRESLLATMRSERTTRNSILLAYLSARKMGQKTDQRRYLFERAGSFGPEDLRAFHSRYVRNKPLTLLLIGRRDKIDFASLRKWGPVREIKKEDLFGY